MRILLVRLSSFGDIVFTLPLATALRASFPGAELAWAVEEPFAPLVEPAADRVLTTRTRAWRKALLRKETRGEIAAFLSEARAFRPDVVVDAQGLFKSAWATLLVPAGRKIGFGFRSATEGVNALVTDERVDVRSRAHVTDRALALVEHLTGRTGFPRRPDVAALASRPEPLVDGWLSENAGPFALLQPFSSARSKEWAADGVVAFARRARESGLASVVRWGPGERDRAEALVAAGEGALALAPPTSPSSSARLAARAALFVGADTGPTHLAAAAGTPTVALFGPTDPARFGPIGPRCAVLPLPRGDYDPVSGADDILRAKQKL